MAGTGRVEQSLELAEGGVAGQGQERRRDRAEEDLVRVGRGDAAEDIAPEVRRADRGGDRRHADRGDRGHADPAQDDRHGQRELDDPEALPAGHPHPERGLGDAPIDAPQAEDRVLDDRQQRIDDQRRPRGGLADLAAEDDQQEAEQRQARHRLEDVGQADDDPLQRRGPRRQDAERDAEGDGQQEGLDDQVQVSGGRRGEPQAFGPGELEQARHRAPPGGERGHRLGVPEERPDEVVRGPFDQVRGAAMLDQSAAVDDRQPVGDPAGLADVVGDEDDGLAQATLQAAELVLELATGDRVERPEGLVHEDEVRVGGQGPGDPHALALPAAELVRHQAREASGIEPDRLQGRPGPVLAHGSRLPRESRHEAHVGQDVQVRHQPHVLDDVADRPPQRDRVPLRGRDARAPGPRPRSARSAG